MKDDDPMFEIERDNRRLLMEATRRKWRALKELAAICDDASAANALLLQAIRLGRQLEHLERTADVVDRPDETTK